MVSSSAPILVAADVLATITFYSEVLGFDRSWTWGEPPTIGAVNWGAVSIMFSQMDSLVGKIEGHQLWFNVEDVDTLCGRHQQKGAEIVSPIEDKPWGVREYTVRDPNGYHLRFAGHANYVPKGTGVFPEGVVIRKHLPTQEDHDHVVSKVFGQAPGSSAKLDKTWGGVSAVAPTGETIGTARIMLDSPGWFSIWDVAVLPEWQGKRIGTAMIEAAVELVREASPGAFIFLFTFKDGFYERIGFGKQSVQMRKV